MAQRMEPWETFYKYGNADIGSLYLLRIFTTLYHVDDTRDLLACIVTLRTFA